jgi:hypothetical protein
MPYSTVLRGTDKPRDALRQTGLHRRAGLEQGLDRAARSLYISRAFGPFCKTPRKRRAGFANPSKNG